MEPRFCSPTAAEKKARETVSRLLANLTKTVVQTHEAEERALRQQQNKAAAAEKRVSETVSSILAKLTETVALRQEAKDRAALRKQQQRKRKREAEAKALSKQRDDEKNTRAEALRKQQKQQKKALQDQDTLRKKYREEESEVKSDHAKLENALELHFSDEKLKLGQNKRDLIQQATKVPILPSFTLQRDQILQKNLKRRKMKRERQ
jgi:hypothetical protein